MKTTKKILAVLLSLSMIVTLTPSLSWAAGEDSPLPDPVNGVITLTSDVTLTAPVQITEDTCLDLNGKKISIGIDYTRTDSVPDYLAFNVIAGTLTIQDNSTDKTGKIEVGRPTYISDSPECIGVFLSGGNVVLESGTLDVSNDCPDADAYGIKMTGSSNATVSGGNILASGTGYPCGAWGIRAEAGSTGLIRVTDGTIAATAKYSSSNQHDAYAIGIRVDGEADVEISGGSITAHANAEAWGIDSHGGEVAVTDGAIRAMSDQPSQDGTFAYSVNAKVGKIKGGTFAPEPYSGYMAEGHICVKNPEEEGTYIVREAGICTVRFYESAAAVESGADPLGTVQLTEGGRLTESEEARDLWYGLEDFLNTETEQFGGWKTVDGEAIYPFMSVYEDTNLIPIKLTVIPSVTLTTTEDLYRPGHEVYGPGSLNDYIKNNIKIAETDAGKYQISRVEWAESAYSTRFNVIHFEEGHRYYLQIALSPCEGYTFPLMNGDEVSHVGGVASDYLDHSRFTTFKFDGEEYYPIATDYVYDDIVLYVPVPYDYGTVSTQDITLHNIDSASEATGKLAGVAIGTKFSDIYWLYKDQFTPAAEGYIFLNWYKDEGLTQALSLYNTVTETLTDLYAKWGKPEYITRVDLVFDEPTVGEARNLNGSFLPIGGGVHMIQPLEKYRAYITNMTTDKGKLGLNVPVYYDETFYSQSSGLDSSQTFQSGQDYAGNLTIILNETDSISLIGDPESGSEENTVYMFTKDTVFTINGETLDQDEYRLGNINQNPGDGGTYDGAMLHILFTPREKAAEEEEPILTADLTVAAPESGASALEENPTVSINDDEPDFIAMTVPAWWTEPESSETPYRLRIIENCLYKYPELFMEYFTGTFEAKKAYTVPIVLKARPGYRFTTEGHIVQEDTDNPFIPIIGLSDGDEEEMPATLTQIRVNGETVKAVSVRENGHIALVMAPIKAVDATADPTPGPNGSGDSTDYTVTVNETENGTVTVEPKTASKGETVTITVTPEEGYEPENVIVTDKNDQPVDITDNGDGTYSFKMPASEVKVAVAFREAGPSHYDYDNCPKDRTCPIWPFKDSDPKAWYHDGVHWALDEGIMNGLSETKFAPNASTTRAMIVTMLWRMEGSPEAEASGFTDLEAGSWYEAAVNWAAANEIVKGYSETSFGPADPVTREQLAAILFRYAEYKEERGEDFAVDLSKYTDLESVSDWAVDAVTWCVGAGIINGMTETTLEPQGTATRAQVATMLMRYSN